jgi:hypothetical protein
MGTPGWIDLFVGPLERLAVPYMVTGSIASMLYGEPRLTVDLDIVVELDATHAAAFLAAFPESEFYRPPLEVVQAEAARDSRGHFKLIHHATGAKADVYLAARDPLHRWGLAQRRRLTTATGAISVAPPEYVIVRKLEFWREGGSPKHLRDVRGMLAAGLELDRGFLDGELARRGLVSAWQELLGST